MKMKILIQISNLRERLNPTDILNRIFQQQQKKFSHFKENLSHLVMNEITCIIKSLNIVTRHFL